MDKETLEKLDKINLLWLLQQISLGNALRGIIFLTELAKSLKECVISTMEEVKTIVIFRQPLKYL